MRRVVSAKRQLTSLNSSRNQLKHRLTGGSDVLKETEFNSPIVYRWDTEAKRLTNESASNRKVAVVVGSL
jgi:hypothetical protein